MLTTALTSKRKVLGDDPTMELSRLDQEDAAAHARYLIEGLM
jgi:hypothetical protein